ncbi:hypothetical protein OPT61_g9161 [Boeremia exigua]|uniref:Uncharacterized protein n=1 Tax=Boeremia exigua TaxID=749465 RepID=A0ACC2HW65_9PLEO|nr:hypothetical protein OPT61_g9161 [Boeremia exigua]
MDIFVHESLNHTEPSIRLLTVLPDLSRDGLIQCSVIHTTIEEAPYNCLSYRWGSPVPAYNILINGKRHHVGCNLFKFLKTFRESPSNWTQEYLWIDAICIAQADLVERNHQVAQMGNIYRNAQVVYIWLGDGAFLAPIIRSIKNWRHPTIEDLATVQSSQISEYLFNNEYWSRAWITQEISLASQAIVLLDNEPIDFSDLISSLESFSLLESGPYKFSAFSQHVKDGLSRSLDGASRSGNPPAESLLSLLSRFRNKRCFVPQDRVFSLLSLCDPACRVQVDYRQNSAQLIWNVLTSNTGPTCICEAVSVVHSLGFDGTLPSARDGSHAWEGYYVDIKMNGIQLVKTPESWAGFDQAQYHLGQYSRAICYMAQKAILSAVHHTMSIASPVRRGDLKTLPTEDLPFIYQKLHAATASRLTQAKSREFSILESVSGSRKYTLRIAMRLILDECSEPQELCPIATRYIPWRYVVWGCNPGEKDSFPMVSDPNFRKIWDSWNSGKGGDCNSDTMIWGKCERCLSKQQGNCEIMKLDLSQHMSFEECIASYGWYMVDAERRFCERNMITKHHIFSKFLGYVSCYICNIETELPASALGRAIAIGKVPGEDYIWGPCHFLRC